VAHQFVVFLAPAKLAFLTGAGLLAGFGVATERKDPAGRTARAIATVMGLLLAGVFSVAAHWTGSGDRAVARAASALRAGDLDASVAAFRSLEAHRRSGVTADLEISRLAAAAAAREREVPRKLVFAQLAASAALAATQSAEERQNAWYNLAVLQAGSNNAAEVENSLRQAIAASPNWYKPHWMLARVLAASGRTGEARLEAAEAHELDGGKHAEVAESLAPLLRSAPP
jgi:hypothetical protein